MCPLISDEEAKRRKAEELILLEKKAQMRKNLPHLYGWKWYVWAREFFESTNKVNLLCAANQISKSSTQIRKCIHWATEPTLWTKLWSQEMVSNSAPQFWYLYPSSKVAEAELREKWMQFLPRDKDDAQYGYEMVRKKGDLIGILFKTGVMVYFKYYSQDTQDLQSGTVFAMFCDEELPVEHYDELLFRLSASSGYFHMVFTATLGQDFWRRAMEHKEGEEETCIGAFKQCISVFDCQVYEDGTTSHWTPEKIAEVIAKCATKAVELKRVWGRFVVAEGLRFEQFDVKKHYVHGHPLPSTWLVYSGVDIGSGGQGGHPSAMCFIGVRPDFRAARVFLGWRGDGIPTTSGSTLLKYIELKKENKIKVITGQVYDFSSPDFYQIASTMGEGSFMKANKAREAGFDLINSLFKHDMLAIYVSPELGKLTTELASLPQKITKTKDRDDFTDALRYGLMQIPFDFSHIVANPSKINTQEDEKPFEEMNAKEQEQHERRNYAKSEEKDPFDIEQEFSDLNELYEG